ncbi:rCG57328, isoform CRA_b [Rattus norvegicus]|uniref:RCG57328, isoform CRA_b n=1 Tax=Rattus norvegicus TaxID=10116 RepID=A6JPG0_RAT|nr:rCG57328, isoform CRA_b [Rattus norvegicus]
MTVSQLWLLWWLLSLCLASSVREDCPKPSTS